MTKEELVQDLAYVRTLAQEGRNAPLIGGGYLVLFGVLLTIAYAVQWAILSGQFGAIKGVWFAYLWGGFGLCATIGALLMASRVKAMPGATSLNNKVDRAVWRGVSVAIFAVVIGAILRMVIDGDRLAPNVIMASGFGLYGVAMGATAVIAAQNWLRAFALLSFVLSGLLWYFLNEPWAYLLAAGGAVVVLIIPGVVMMRREPSAVV